MATVSSSASPEATPSSQGAAAGSRVRRIPRGVEMPADVRVSSLVADLSLFAPIGLMLTKNLSGTGRTIAVTASGLALLFRPVLKGFERRSEAIRLAVARDPSRAEAILAAANRGVLAEGRAVGKWLAMAAGVGALAAAGVACVSHLSTRSPHTQEGT